MSPWAPLGRDSFSHFPCLWWLWQFWGVLVRYYVGCSSVETCLIFIFKLIRLGNGFGRKVTRVKCPFCYIILRVHPINMIYDCWCWPWPPGWSSVCQISLLKSYSPTPPPPTPCFHTVLFGRKSLGTTPTPEGWNIYISYFEFFCMGALFLLHLFV